MWALFSVGGLLVGSLAAAMTFLTMYEEYSRHPNLSRREALKQSLQMAGSSFLFFVLLYAAVGAALSAMLWTR